jgi:hypothetical protein
MECHQVVVDFDLLAVFLMQEADPKMHIRCIVDLLLLQFQTSTSDTAQPHQTTLQSQLLHGAETVCLVIQSYDQALPHKSLSAFGIPHFWMCLSIQFPNKITANCFQRIKWLFFLMRLVFVLVWGFCQCPKLVETI